MRLKDGPRDYGWVSIALHWAGAALVLTMLFIGNSIQDPGGLQEPMLRLHISLGLVFYLLLWARILWRLRMGHPGPLPKQKPLYYGLGKAFHHVLLGAIAVMLVTGPLTALTGGMPLGLFGLHLVSLPAAAPALFTVLHQLHWAAANVLGWGTLVHVIAVIKHAAIDRDGALDKILVPLDGERP